MTSPFPLPACAARLRRLACRCALAAALAAGASAQAQTVTIATWNVNWLLDAATHAHWIDACRRADWPTRPETLPPAVRATLAGLPYCNVHNGMRFPPERCRSTRDDWPDAARYPDVHPCRDTADLAAWPRYEGKLAALRAMFARLDAQGVTVVALQEVAGVAAVQAILPAGWSAATTAELPGAPAIAQHVGVAWRRGVAVRDVGAVVSLADSGVAERPLRPGLAFTVDVAGAPVRVLVVHLKAGCRSRDIDAPLTAQDARLPQARQDAIASDCALLRYQMPALEAWIDAQARGDFAVLGDFNRTLLREPLADSATWHTRLDGTAPGAPLGPCTMAKEGERWVARCPAKTRALFPELNDGVPPGAVLWRARLTPPAGDAGGPQSAAGCRIAGDHGNLAHEGIDHVLISASLQRRLAAAALAMQVVNYTTSAGEPLHADATVALPSDHCPHVVTWARKARP